MNSNPYISIIIPVYNVEKYISRCLDSVINQTLKEIEIIVVNDDTKDNSLEIINNYAKKDSRILVYSKKNEGLGLTRNYGIDKAHGKYIAFLDSDDYVDLDFYEKLYEDAEKKDADATFTNIKLYTQDGKIIQNDKMAFKSSCVQAKKYMYNLLHVEDKEEYGKNYMGMCVWRSIYRKSIINDNNIRFSSEREFISEDILFNIDFCMNSKKISFIDGTYYYYCFNGNSLTKTYKVDRFDKDIILYKELIRKLKEYGEYENVKRGVAAFFLGYVRGVIKQEICNSSKNKKEIKKEIKKIASNSIVREAIKESAYENITKEIISILIKVKFVNLIYLIYYLKDKRRN